MYKFSTHRDHPHDALTAASAALSALSLLIGDRNELSLEAGDCFGLSVMMDAIHDDMNTVADVIKNDYRQREESERQSRDCAAAEYERGFQNGIAEGLRDNPQAEQRIAEILAQAMAKHSDAPIPKLTEEALPAQHDQGQAGA